MVVHDDTTRARETISLSAMVASERARILSAANPAQRKRMEAAEHARTVYRAWNAVCDGTREGAHVTGLRYLPDTNELLVYLDGASWTQEMTMLREIIRARMERAGARVDGFVFRTSKPGYGAPRCTRVSTDAQAVGGAHESAAACGAGEATPPGDASEANAVSAAASLPARHTRSYSSSKARRPEERPAPRVSLTAAEDEVLQEAVAPIEDEKLRKSLKNAMKASMEWKKSQIS